MQYNAIMNSQQFQLNHLIEPTKCFQRFGITPTNGMMCSTERQQNCVLWIQISHPFPSPKILGLHRHNLDARGRNLKPGQGQHVFDSAAFCRASRHCFSAAPIEAGYFEHQLPWAQIEMFAGVFTGQKPGEPMWTWGSCNVATLFTNLFCSTLSKSAKGMALSWRQIHHPETTGNTETPAVTDICSSFYRLLRAVFTSECLSKIYPTTNSPDQYQSIRYSTAILWTFGDFLGLWTLRSDSGLHTDMVICTTSQDSPINGPQWLRLKIMGEKNDHWWVIWQLYAIIWLLFEWYTIYQQTGIICI